MNSTTIQVICFLVAAGGAAFSTEGLRIALRLRSPLMLLGNGVVTLFNVVVMVHWARRLADAWSF